MEAITEKLEYSPETGVFTWKNRDIAIEAGSKSYGYVRIKINRVNYLAHRLAWLFVHGSFPEDQIDHINGDVRDNRIENLRCVDRFENMKNQKKRIDNKSGVTGVRWVKDRFKWRAYMKLNKKHIHLGSFKYKWDAICSRKSAENKYGFHENHGRG